MSALSYSRSDDEKCYTDNKGMKSECCQTPATTPSEKDRTIEKLIEERNEFKEALTNQLKMVKELKEKLVLSEKLNKEKDANIKELNKIQGKAGCLDFLGEMVVCSGCSFLDNEKRFSVCQTCTKEHTNLDVSNCEALSEKNLKLFAVCDKCTLEHHFGHELVDYYPVLASINHRAQVVDTSITLSKLDKVSEKIQENMDDLKDMIEQDAKQVANEMTEELKEATSSNAQKETSHRIKECYDTILEKCEIFAEKIDELFYDIDAMLIELKNGPETEDSDFELVPDMSKAIECDIGVEWDVDGDEEDSDEEDSETGDEGSDSEDDDSEDEDEEDDDKEDKEEEETSSLFEQIRNFF